MRYLYCHIILWIKKYILRNAKFCFSSKVEGECFFSGNFDIGSNCRFINAKVSGNVIIDDFVSVADNTLLKGSYDKQIQIGFGSIIGPNCLISTDYHYRHDGVINDSLLNRMLPHDHASNKREINKSIYIGKHVWIGCNVYIKPGVVINDYATIGANSVVTRDVLEKEIYIK